ncbi:Lnb N-terminal periplasmic domain-containing protein [Namhaeicola litoreus]|uniref:DUF4105 domain-containing protein n=1 Tax=Namhaeicola litoreus TaxID=1052145 RepID=A0ABW3Y4I9_9FLAO
MQRNFLVLACLICWLSSFSQSVELSENAEISVITCGPGNELYSTFGHSAFRIQDKKQDIDKVYNYGTFNFATPNFYVKFVRGKLLYELRAYPFYNFLRGYRDENRWVKEQILNLNLQQKQAIYAFLEENEKPANRGYKYDFFYDNCSTKMYEVLEKTLNDQLVFDSNYEPNDYTHRELIQQYLGNLKWSDFGIDLALGSVIDRTISPKQYMFLPDYVLKAMDHVKLRSDKKEIPLVRESRILLQSQPQEQEKSLFTPLLVFSLLALLVIFITYMDYKKKTRNSLLDILIFSITGLVGVLLLVLWFATDHTATANNFNILWAFAPNIFFVFLLNKNTKLRVYYMLTLLVCLDLLLIIWSLKVQIFSVALVPILVALYLRYIYLWVYFKKKNSIK